ncbi:MAG TPA: homoaconitase [Clostridia bacterium]|nr:homoaconitase [Clostridia bacterium]
MGQTIVEKIAKQHMTEGPSRPLRAGDFVSLRPAHILTHDNTSAVIKKFKSIGAARVFDARQPVFALDHDIQNLEESNLKKYREIEAFAAQHGIDFYPAGTGIGHQVMVENGYVLPGSLVVASDSHSNMYGALGAVGTPVVRTDAAAVWATGEFWWQIPRTIQVVLTGKLRPGVTGKDVIITLCGLYNKEEALNAAIEFAGEGVSSLSIEERLSISNMTTEWGALVGWFPADDKTFEFLRSRRSRLVGGGIERLAEAKLAQLERELPMPDADATYAGRIELDLAQVTPHVSGPDTVQRMESLAEITPKRIKINKAYLLSCVNSRLEDLTAAADVLRGRQVAPGVEFYAAAASADVQRQAEANGAWHTLLAAGAKPLPPSCGPCIGLGTGLLEPGEVGISATNRNFKGRMGSRDARCYLASPAVVAASAIAGYITAPFEVPAVSLAPSFVAYKSTAPVAERVEIIAGFPARVAGRLVFCPADNLNTDGIYGKDYTYREDMTRDMMARVVMENYDPQFASATRAGDVVIGGFNFGTGSSREQAVTALQAKGIPLVIAGSFSQTYLRNAFNNGFLSVECPEFVLHLKQVFAEKLGGERTIIPGDETAIDFSAGTIHYRGENFSFPAMGSVPQSLVAAGGVENLVKQRLTAAAGA